MYLETIDAEYTCSMGRQKSLHKDDATKQDNFSSLIEALHALLFRYFHSDAHELTHGTCSIRQSLADSVAHVDIRYVLVYSSRHPCIRMADIRVKKRLVFKMCASTPFNNVNDQ